MRDIAADAGMKAGSLYYHFPSKAELLIAVHEEGIRRITADVNEAIECTTLPRDKLKAAMIAHLESLLGGGDYAQVVIREFPQISPEQRKRLIGLRDDYEDIFRQLVNMLPIQSDRSQRHLRLMILGALNWTPTWYQPGDETPADIAKGFLDLVRDI
jgi:AcrR family transcriptional regulator